MKKKIIIPLIAVLFVLIIGILSIINYNKIVYTITLDINPGIEISLNKNKKVVSIIALNDATKEIVDGHLKGKTIEKAYCF